MAMSMMEIEMVYRFIRKHAREEAAKMLTTTSERIGMIADTVGIRNQAYFSKCFRECYGMSPRAFREKYYCLDDEELII